MLNQCGTQFIDELGSGGQAYLENTIIIQMQEEIQEVRFSNFWSIVYNLYYLLSSWSFFGSIVSCLFHSNHIYEKKKQ